MKGKSFYISIAVAIVVSLFYLHKFTMITGSVKESGFKFTIPKIAVIKREIPKMDLIRYSYVWGEEPSGLSGKNTLSKRSGSSVKTDIPFSYVYKKIRGVPSICMTSNIKYRWEFYGTMYRSDRYFAIFYNPALKRVAVLPAGKQLDRGLTIKRIDQDEVYVKYGKKDFILKVFEFRVKRRV